VLVVAGHKTTAGAQEANLPSVPTSAESTTPTPRLTQPGTPPVTQPALSEATDPPEATNSSEATDPNLVTPPVANNRGRVRASPVSASQNSTRGNNAFSPRLARAPFLMGDSVAPSLVFQNENRDNIHKVPLGGGATRSKIAENSSSLPVDRLIFNYNHFQNAIDENQVQSTDIDRFTLGFEKTFHDQMMSVEVRMPFVADNDFQNADFTRNGSDVGNLSVTFKGVLTSDSVSLLAAGLTIDTPTGGSTVLTNRLFADPLTVDISNDAVHLSPFLGFLYAPGGGNTHQTFLQVDVATNPNGLTFTDGSGVTSTELLEQTLLYVDYQFAKELYHAGGSSRSGHGIRRILGLAEIHYTTTLEDSDVVFSGTPSNPQFEVTSAGNRLDVVNLTLGLHTELKSGAQIRLGTVAPITDGDDRFFDFEFQAQLNILL